MRQVPTPCPSAAAARRSFGPLRGSFSKQKMGGNQTVKKLTAGKLTLAAVTAALYVALSYVSGEFAFGGAGMVQCRLSEALTVLPFFFPETAWGLFVGCILTNVLSPMGIPDLVLGSLATLIAALATARMSKKWLAPLPPVLANGIIIGAMIGWFEAGGFNRAFWPAFAVNGALVALGEAIACYVLGMLILWQLPRIPYFRKRISASRL